MKSTIVVWYNNHPYEVSLSVFPGGEVNIKLPEIPFWQMPEILVEAKLRCSDGVMALALVKEAIDHVNSTNCKTTVRILYIPYARQDRRCNKGESLSSKVFASLINMMNWTFVQVADPHSDVSVALLDRVDMNYHPKDILGMYRQHNSASDLAKLLRDGEFLLCAPDVGASKKVAEVASEFGHDYFIQGHKHRDLKTGKLSGFGYTGDVKGYDVLIVDDICDGGGTFVGLAKELLDGHARTVSLYVTHGIFSRGVENLLDNGIDTIYTTNTYYEGPTTDLVKVIKL